ncbi:universal stress protein [Nocardioides sp.]|uniref:universal stress protein n=1 Tax=Nocardioides sp. TaxID=35761 RepID=UPI002ED3A8FF
MNAVTASPVVVGVDGSSGSRAATLFAVGEARRLEAPLKLVHVVPTYSAMPPAPMMALPPIDLVGTGERILERAESEVRAVAPDLTIETELRRGVRHHELAGAATDASQLVVGQDKRPLLDRLLLGNTVTGVASRATCPVTSVPHDWDPAADHGLVVVGVKAPAHAEELLGEAFAVASARSATLLVLHAWRLPGGYDDIIADRVATEEWTERTTKELDEVLAPWRRVYPDVTVETKVVHDYAPTALEQASRDADLLVLVRRAHGVPAATHLGGTARGVLRTAACPVRVVPPRPVRSSSGPTSEQAHPAGAS